MRQTRTPTRVRTACDRCRRQKQRCDDFRPCNNCLNVKLSCTTTDVPPPAKKAKTQSRAEVQETNATYGNALVHIRPLLPSTESAKSTIQSDSLGQWTDVTQESRFSHQDEQSTDVSVLADLGSSESAMGITKRILGYDGSPTNASDRATYAIPGGDPHRTLTSSSLRGRPVRVVDILGVDLPARDVCDALIDAYFATVHWFSLVLFEPKFRLQYVRVMDSGVAYRHEQGFLHLLLMVIIMGCWYGPGVLPGSIASATDLAHMRKKFLKVICQNFMDLIDEDCLEFVQLCTLLGSYWLYWGRPRSAFSILGAATKTAQAMEMHRVVNKSLSFEEVEERKRVWWTIYTWDRFATTIYGRPLGVNDKDCNVAMPVSFSEDVSFIQSQVSIRVCLSPYQIQLNRIYQITSPLLENIYGIRYSNDRALRSQMLDTVSKIEGLMRAWHDNLPPHLCLDRHDDICTTSSAEEKMHRLQALALQLTYDNLMIVIHRPLLADQNSLHLHVQRPGELRRSPIDQDQAQINHAENTHHTSFRQCLDSALRISRVQQRKRNLISLARKTHLVSFFGMNLFTSSVVMFICALSDILSDVAQEAKRGMARNLKMLKLLSGDGSLSMQCSMILEDLVQKIIDREKDEMLRSLPSDDEAPAFLPTRKNSRTDQFEDSHDTAVNLSGVWSQGDDCVNQQETLVNNLSSTYEDNVFSLQRTMASLQKVFKDVATPRMPMPTTGGGNEHVNQRSVQQDEWQDQVRPNISTESAGLMFDNSGFNVEDLGQFWLWNIDPGVEDGILW